ncbi:hypothetical protein N0V85_002154 [Neurospora sp. IMI 360204]|nr:hypothetical protein N0V85_002154 [Neurospora sp. IMI 360204]
MEDASDDPDDGLPEDEEELEEEEPPENPEWFQLGPDEPDDDQLGTPHATALHIAASLGRIDLVEFFAGKNGIFMNATDCDGRNPLHYAAHAMLKHPRAVIRKLVQMGARLDAQNDIDFELIVRSVGEGRCAVAIDLLQLRAYKNLTTERLGDLMHAALTPAALYTFERGISIANLSGSSYSRYSVLLPPCHRGSYNSGYPNSTSYSDIDSLERQELVRLLVKQFGVNVNGILPSIPETPVTLIALCNASSSGMLRCLLDLGADITKVNGNGDTAIHCAMRLYARGWKTLDQSREYELEPWADWDETGVGRSPDSVLCSLVAAWPGDRFNAVNKDGIDVLTCIFDSVFWEDRRYIDLAILLNSVSPAYYMAVVPRQMPPAVGLIEKTMRFHFVESLFCLSQLRTSGPAYDIDWSWGWSTEKEKVRKDVISKLTEIRRKLRMAAAEQVVMGAFVTYANFSGKKSGRLPNW